MRNLSNNNSFKPVIYKNIFLLHTKGDVYMIKKSEIEYVHPFR